MVSANRVRMILAYMIELSTDCDDVADAARLNGWHRDMGLFLRASTALDDAAQAVSDAYLRGDALDREVESGD